MVGIRVGNRVLRIYEYLYQRLRQDVPIRELQGLVPKSWTVSTVLRQLALGHGATIEVTVAYSSHSTGAPTRYLYGQYDPPSRPKILTAKLLAPAPKPLVKTRHMSELDNGG